MILRNLFLLLPLLAPVAAAGGEGDEVLFNQVYLEAQAQRDVPNDEMVVLLQVEHQGANPRALAERVNQDMAWALAILKGEKEVETRTLGYQTSPIYEKRVISGWRVSQQLQLTSTAVARLTELVGKLQERLQVRGMQFQPSREAREKVEDELIEEALAAFRRRAAIVGRQMQGGEYRIVNLHVNTGGGPRPMVYAAERAAMTSMDTGVPPAVEAGTSEVTVTASGSVQFYAAQ